MCCSVIPCNGPSDNSAVHVFQLPHKPQTSQGYAGKTETKKSQTLAASKPSAHADKPTAARRTSTQKIQKTPQVKRCFHTDRVVFFKCSVVVLQSSMQSVDLWIMCWVGKKRKGRWLAKQERKGTDRDRVWESDIYEGFTGIHTQNIDLNVRLMAEEGVGTVERNFIDKVQSYCIYFKGMTRKGL